MGAMVDDSSIETAIKVSTFIDQAMVVGQDEKALGALIVVSNEALEHDRFVHTPPHAVEVVADARGPGVGGRPEGA